MPEEGLRSQAPAHQYLRARVHAVHSFGEGDGVRGRPWLAQVPHPQLKVIPVLAVVSAYNMTVFGRQRTIVLAVLSQDPVTIRFFSGMNFTLLRTQEGRRGEACEGRRQAPTLARSLTGRERRACLPPGPRPRPASRSTFAPCCRSRRRTPSHCPVPIVESVE